MNWRCQKQKLRTTLMLGACVGCLSMALPASAPDVSVSAPGTLVEIPNTQLSVQQLRSCAQAITVKVLGADVLGSGFLIKKQGSVYTVLTNAHVLRAGAPPYRLQTPDGHMYPANLLKNTQFKSNDLALLQFRSPHTTYPLASLGSSFTLAVGQNVFAAGFAIAGEFKPSVVEFKFTSGQVSLVLDKALSGGYQIGYTNDIAQGMSGGPLLNRRGEVVGVNGQHAYPLWDAPSVFQDGSKASPRLHELINRLSFAVPIETVVQHSPPSIQLNSRLTPPLAFYEIF